MVFKNQDGFYSEKTGGMINRQDAPILGVRLALFYIVLVTGIMIVLNVFVNIIFMETKKRKQENMYLFDAWIDLLDLLCAKKNKLRKARF